MLTTYQLLSQLDFPRSALAHGASLGVPWGRCWDAAQLSLEALTGDDEHRDFFQHCRYAEGWLVMLATSPSPAHLNGPLWHVHGFMLAPDDQVIDPFAARRRFKLDTNWQSFWVPVFTHVAATAIEFGSLPHGGGMDDDDDISLLDEMRAARAAHEPDLWALAQERHTVEHGQLPTAAP